MKKIFLSLAMVSMTLAFAQKKEISSAVSAIDSDNAAEALSQIQAADNLLAGKMYLLSPAEQEQYYYAKGLALLKSGKTAEGANVLAKINDLKDNKIFSGKDNDKNKVFYVGKAEADKLGAGLKLKESDYTPTLSSKIPNIINPILQKVSSEAQENYNNEKYGDAAKQFLEVNDLLKAAGQPDETYEYYAAISYALGKDNKSAIGVLQHLIDTGYTGVKTTYTALNKKTNERDTFDEATFKLIQKSPDYSDPKTEVSDSKEETVYDTAASLMIDEEMYDQAIDVLNKAIAKFPNNSRFNDLKMTAYSKSGNAGELEKSIRESLAKNPNDKVVWTNLGIIKSKNQENPADATEAEEAFQKALSIDPTYNAALRGIVYNYFLNADVDKKAIDEYNTLRKAGKIDDANKILESRRVKFRKALPYLEKMYELNHDDADAVNSLKNIYNSLDMTDKAKKMADEEKRIQGQQ